MKRNIVVLVALVILAGCATEAPTYRASFDATNKLKDAGQGKVTLGEFKAGGTNPEKVNKLTIRGGEFKAPTSGSYVEYLKQALRQQLYDANRLDANASVEITGVLVKNEIDASGLKIGLADISAQFVVHRSGKKEYDKVTTIHHEWESAFAAANAVPLAHANYLKAMQLLLDKLFSDTEFMRAIR